MLHEFALDPEVIADWNSLRFFADRFGISQGRLISEFPKRSKWKRLVFDAVSRKRLSDIERSKVVEKLAMIDSKFLKQFRLYNGETSWINNVVEQNESLSFHAIITDKNLPNLENILVADEVGEDTEKNQLWNVQTQRRVPRVANDLAQAVSSLLKISQEIIFIDPHFNPDARRFRRPLENFLQEALHENNTIKRIEYYLKFKYENYA